MPRLTPALACVLAMALVVAFGGSATAASSSTVVTATIPSAIQLANGCVGSAATQFGVVQPNTPATTAANACTVTWGSSNDSSMLRIAQRDATGTAMSREASFAGSIDWDRFTDVASANGTNLVAVGNGGRISRSANGGSTWSTNNNLGGIGNEITHVVQLPSDPTVAWVVGYGLRLQRVTSALTAPTPTNMFPNLVASGWSPTASPIAVVMIDDDSLIVGGEQGYFARSDNNGATWTSFQMPSTSQVRDLTLAPTGHVWAATRGNAAGNIWRAPSAAGGAAVDWTQYPVAGTSTLYEIEVPGASNGYAVGSVGSIYSWNGTTWSYTGNAALMQDHFFDVQPVPGSPASAIAVGEDGTILRSINGGTSWTTVPAPVSTHVSATIAGAGWMLAAGGSQSVITSANGGSSWSFVSDDVAARNNRGVAMAPVDGRIVIGVGTRGTIQRSTNAGASWSTPASGTTQGLFDVAFASTTRVWAVGEGGTLLRSDDAGATWSTVPTGTTNRLRGVSAPNEQTVLAVGHDGTVIRSTNAGASFSVASIAAGYSLRSISMATPLVGVLVGPYFVRRTTDGGQTWTAPTTMPSLTRMADVSMANATVGFIAESYGGIWRTADGGNTWARTAMTETFDSIVAVNSDVVHAGGGNLWTSLDGGTTWANRPKVGPDIAALASGDANYVVYGTAQGGILVRSADATPGVAVPDYGGAPNSWASSAQGMFGVCVQSPGAQTSMSGPWIADADTCTASDGDPWRAIPTTPSTLATVPVAGNTGSVDLVWGVRFAPTQPPGTYTAGVVFEALAPAV